MFFLCQFKKILNGKASARTSLCLRRLQYTLPAKSFLFCPFENLIHMFLALLLLWHLWLLILVYILLTLISVTVIMCTCHTHLVRHSGCVLYPTLSPCLGGHAGLSWWTQPVHFTSSLWDWQTCPHCGYDLLVLPANSLGVLLGTPSAGLLISSSHLLPLCGLWF